MPVVTADHQFGPSELWDRRPLSSATVMPAAALGRSSKRQDLRSPVSAQERAVGRRRKRKKEKEEGKEKKKEKKRKEKEKEKEKEEKKKKERIFSISSLSFLFLFSLSSLYLLSPVSLSRFSL